MIIVAGMHRSGTSAVARALVDMGLYPGADDRLMAGHDTSNPEGHFEHLDFVSINNAVLEAVGAGWAAPVRLSASTAASLLRTDLGDRARALRAETIDQGIDFLKDPRASLTLPFWRPVFGDDLSVVIPWRRSEPVARSLERRNDFPVSFGRLLWEEYNRLALVNSDGCARFTVSFEDLLADRAVELGRLAGFITSLGHVVDVAAAIESIDPSTPENVSAEATEDTDRRRAIAAALRGAQTPDLPDIDNSPLFELSGALAPASDRLRDAEWKLEWSTDQLNRQQRILGERRQRIEELEAGAADLARLREQNIALHQRHANAAAELQALRSSDMGAANAASTPTEAQAAPEAIPAPVSLPSFDEPLVSIVVPVYGQLAYTARCLHAIAEHTPAIPYEVIVVDDASPDDVTGPWLQQCTNVTLVSNPTNIGYLRATNAGAERATGKYVLLLNNDTEVHDGWLNNMVDLAESDPTIGIVGAKLLFPDDTIQEAGSIVWNDGTAWNFGRTLHFNYYNCNYVRDVDYCSAACLLVLSSLWQQVGGFDEQFAPAYYEDVDLCFAARAEGLRVVYQPEAKVTHFEKISHGSDGSNELMSANHKRFAAKWASQLATQHAPRQHLSIASTHGRARRIVIIDQQNPQPSRDAGSVRMMAIIDLLLQEGYRVTFVPQDAFRRQPDARLLMQRGVELFYGKHGLPQLFADRAPETLGIICSRPIVTIEYLRMLRRHAPDVPVAYDMVDYHALRMSRSRDLGMTPPKIVQAMAEFEAACMRATDVTVAVSDEEAAQVRADHPSVSTHVVPVIQQARRSATSFAERRGVLFVGNWNHQPNRQATKALTDEIMPLVWQSRPDIELHLVGSDMPTDDLVKGVNGPVVAHGWVESLDGLFEEVSVSVAPITYGAGQNGKVSNSAIRGVPVVASSIAAEGFGDVASAIAVADGPEATAAAILQLHNDSAAWDALSRNGMQLMQQRFGMAAGRRSVNGLLEIFEGQRGWDA